MPGFEELADTMVTMAGTALNFGMIDRTAVYHPDNGPRESDTDHTVMLGWIACSLAQAIAPELNRGLIAQLALAHDAPEVFAGDTQTLRISNAERLTKREREHEAWLLLREMFEPAMPWLTQTIYHYEGRVTPEARFVWAVDKSLPKLVHLLDDLRGLREFGMDREELEDFFARQRESIAGMISGQSWAPEFLGLYSGLVRRVLDHPGWRAAS